MKISNVSNSNFGQLIIQRERGMRTPTPEQSELIFYINEKTDGYKSTLLSDLEDARYSDVILKTKKNGDVNLFVRKELPITTRDGASKSYIPYSSDNRKKLKTCMQMNKICMPQAKKQIGRFLQECREYINKKLANKNIDFEKMIEEQIQAEIAERLIELGLGKILISEDV